MDEVETTQQSQAHEDTASFADGDLGRIQGILFGDHARRVDERLATLEAALLGAIADLRGELHTSFQALEKRVGSEEANRAKAMKNLGERLDSESEVRIEGESAINHKIETTESAIHAKIGTSESAIHTKIDATEAAIRNVIAAERTAAAADVDRELSSLRGDSVNRRDLAELFSATADHLRGTDDE